MMAANPNPARITDELWAVWEGFDALEPIVQLGGIYAPKSGYHDTRDANPPTNYSVAQYAIDKQGPGDKAAAIDLTFPDAQAGDYRTINKYSQRLLAAGQAGRTADPRTVFMREFYGNIDTDSEVEGWDYARHGAASSDSSHLWHIHISVHRGYVTDPEMTKAILSILKGETVAQWLGVPTDEEEDEVKGIILEDDHSIVLYFLHPTLGTLVWQNIVSPAIVNTYKTLGWVYYRAAAGESIDKYGQDLASVNKKLLDAIAAGGGGAGGPLDITLSGTAVPK